MSATLAAAAIVPRKVFVYFNLHRQCWSVKALNGPERGRVIARPQEVTLFDCAFRVSESGRQRVLREQRKNVHAGVVGYMEGEITAAPTHEGAKAMRRVSYNPYRFGHFFDCETQEPVAKAAMVSLTAQRQVFVI